MENRKRIKQRNEDVAWDSNFMMLMRLEGWAASEKKSHNSLRISSHHHHHPLHLHHSALKEWKHRHAASIWADDGGWRWQIDIETDTQSSGRTGDGRIWYHECSYCGVADETSFMSCFSSSLIFFPFFRYIHFLCFSRFSCSPSFLMKRVYFFPS